MTGFKLRVSSVSYTNCATALKLFCPSDQRAKDFQFNANADNWLFSRGNSRNNTNICKCKVSEILTGNFWFLFMGTEAIKA